MKIRNTKHLVRLVFAAAIAAVAAPSARAQEGGIMVGAEAPSAKVSMLDGMGADLAKFYGDKPVVLEFWATWCPLCKKLEPALQAAREKYAGKVTFVGVGVSSSQTAMKQKEYIEKQHLTGEYVFDDAGAAVKAFMAPHTSYIVVIDSHRKVVYTGVGPDQDIEAAVKKGLGGM
jgi:thiol-disulfide isomerase/thioredoxin